MNKQEVLERLDNIKAEKGDILCFKTTWDGYVVGTLHDVGLYSGEITYLDAEDSRETKDLHFSNIKRITKIRDSRGTIKAYSGIKIFRVEALNITSKLQEEINGIKDRYVGRDVTMYTDGFQRHSGVIQSIEFIRINTLDDKCSLEPIFKVELESYLGDKFTAYSDSIMKIDIYGGNKNE